MAEASALATLMGAYFHQDIFDEHEDEFAAVREFVDGQPQLALALVRDISGLLATAPSEHVIREHLDALGNSIEPDHGVTYRAWLTHIADVARAATD